MPPCVCTGCNGGICLPGCVYGVYNGVYASLRVYQGVPCLPTTVYEGICLPTTVYTGVYASLRVYHGGYTSLCVPTGVLWWVSSCVYLRCTMVGIPPVCTSGYNTRVYLLCVTEYNTRVYLPVYSGVYYPGIPPCVYEGYTTRVYLPVCEGVHHLGIPPYSRFTVGLVLCPPLSSRFTVGLVPSLSPPFPCHCWASSQSLSLSRFTVGLVLIARPPSRFTVGLGKGGERPVNPLQRVLLHNGAGNYPHPVSLLVVANTVNTRFTVVRYPRPCALYPHNRQHS